MSNHEVQVEPEDLPLSVYDYLDRPHELRETLKDRGALTFKPYPSGLFPASNLPVELGIATGMNMAWFRDNAHVANALFEAGETDLAAPVAKAELAVLHNCEHRLDAVLAGDTSIRLPVRVDGVTLENDTENRFQNDSTGYALWNIARTISGGHIRPTEADLAILAKTARYLERIEYWRTPDDGHWEEDARVQVASIGTVDAGLKAVHNLFVEQGYNPGLRVDLLAQRGEDAMYAMLEQGITDYVVSALEDDAAYPYPSDIRPDVLVANHFRNFSHRSRNYDAAVLFLDQPLGVLSSYWADRVVSGIEEHLVRPYGVIRYPGDTYWMPRFPQFMGIGERTHAAEGRLEKRNQSAAGVSYVSGEAQWTLFDPSLSVHWAANYQVSGDVANLGKQLTFLNRSLSQLVTKNGVLLAPEARYRDYTPGDSEVAEFDGWIPNDHMPLLWTQANLLRALLAFEKSLANTSPEQILALT